MLKLLEFLKRKAQYDWSNLVKVDYNSAALPTGSGFARDCRDIIENAAFDVVFNDFVNELLKSSIKDSHDNEHFKLKMAAILGAEKLREKFKTLSVYVPDVPKEEFDPSRPF